MKISHRASTLSPAAHELYRVLINEVVATGRAPQPERSDALDELERNDWLVLDAQGQVDVLYPFSPSETPVEVRFNGYERYAMCATDALGLAPMLDADVRITTTCPQSGTDLQIDLCPDGTMSGSHPAIAVLRRRQAGAAHTSRCGATRFFRSAADAETWRSEQGRADDVVLSLEAAYEEAATMFGRCYSDGVRVWL